MRTFLLMLTLVSALSAAEIVNYRTGINLTLSGTEDVDWAIEEEYFDPVIQDRKVIYIRAETEIGFTHNLRNVARISTNYYTQIGYGVDGIRDTADDGLIRYRIDADMHQGPRWTTGQGGTANPLFSYGTPLKFSTLTYPSGVAGGFAVLGKTGSNGAPYVPKTGHFHYGIVDDFGDEWHTIQVADDDWAVTGTDTEWRSSDGKVFRFVVNPKTARLKITATGNAQYYTSPPKVYNVPKIFAQTTWFSARSGSIALNLKDIFGGTVRYRINGEGWLEGVSIDLTHESFPTGQSTLEYYVVGNEANVKTRIIHRDPPYPSAGESHGYLWAGNVNNMNKAIERRLLNPYKYHWDQLVVSGNGGGRSNFETNFRRQGKRHVPASQYGNAVAARILGVTANAPSSVVKTFALFAKEMLLESGRTIDNVGFEMPHAQMTLPTRELTYRGYYDVEHAINTAYAYDILISIFREDQGHADGITPIEDYVIRDYIANDIAEALQFSGAWQGTTASVDTGGMWDVARKIGAFVGMFAIPSYSSNYYGTSGMDGNSTLYPWTPFPTPVTWRSALLDEDQPLLGYPNLANKLGIDVYNARSDGHFTDRSGYVGLMGRVFRHVAMILPYHYPSKRFPYMEAYFQRAVEGTIMGMQNGSGPARYIPLALLNSKYPAIADYAIPFVRSQAAGTAFSDGNLINGNIPYDLAHYEWDYVPGVAAPDPDPEPEPEPVKNPRRKRGTPLIAP